MKLTLLSSLVIGTVLAAPAQDAAHGHAHLGRRHAHAHAHAHPARPLAKRDVVIVYETVTVDRNGKTLGTGTATTTEQQAPAAQQATPALDVVNVPQALKVAEPVAAPAPAQTTRAAAVASQQQAPKVDVPIINVPAPSPKATTAAAKPVDTPAPAPVQAPAPAAPVSNSGSNSGVGNLAIDGSSGASVASPLGDFVPPSTPFQDGKHACSSFPGQYDGVVSLPYLGKGGYNSIQLGSGNFEQIDSCKPGYYCSYACQPGMSKTQWPEDGQPANGVSIGGLKCGSDGKLYLARPSVPFLCQWDHQAALVENQAGRAIAIGRTVYPGSENMVDPTFVKPGAIAPLSVPDQNIFKWRGNPTSAQYYVNNAGVSQQDGCAWGTPGSTLGNWAPMNFGAGYADGIAWLALIGNPNNQAGTNFKIKIVSVSGTMNGECGYDGTKYTGSSSTSNGCTVACKGVCKFVMY